MEYIQFVANKIIKTDLFNERKIVEALLWRGFLVTLNENNEILLSKGLTQSDFTLLKKIFLKYRITLESLQDPSFSGRIILDKRISNKTESIINDILSIKTKRGRFTSTLMEDAGWISFKNLKYGSKIDIEDLDIGVALLVKSIALTGTYTILSCDGHHASKEDNLDINSYPKIWFGKIHLKWFKSIFDNIIKPNLQGNLKCNWVWSFSEANWLEVRKKNKKRDSYNNKDFFDVDKDIQNVARFLMDVELIKYLQQCKEIVNTEVDIEKVFIQHANKTDNFIVKLISY